MTEPNASGHRCRHCFADLGGGPGGWFSLASHEETCTESQTTFHEGEPISDNEVTPSAIGHWDRCA